MFLPLLLTITAAALQPPAETPAYRQPQLAAAGKDVVLAFGAGSSIFVSASADNGRTFGAPHKVADTGALALGRHRGPRITLLKDAWVVTAIAGERKAEGPHAHGLPEAGNLLVWRSVDRGRTWSRAATINDVPGAAREGLHAVAADAKGVLHAAWLDLRETGTRLYGSRSADGGRTWSKNALIYESPDGTICQCCHPSIAAAPDGRIAVMWRNAVNGSRDLYLAEAAGAGFGPARKLGEGTWKLNACPMDGGAIAFDGGRIVTAWRREGDLYAAVPGQPEKRLGEGKDVALAVAKSGVYTAWTRGTAVEVLTPSGGTPQQLGDGGFVSLLALPGGGVLAAWEAPNSIETRVLR